MQTPLQITFKNLDSSDALESRIRERAAKLERFYDNITGCRCVVEVPHRSPGSGKTPIGLSVEVEVPGRLLVSKGEEEPHESKGDTSRVVTRVFDAMERQLEEQASVRNREVKAHETAVETGRISRLFPEQSYGFVETGGGPNLYFTVNALSGLTMAELEIGMMVKVTRATTEGPMGPQASSVGKLGDQDRMAP